MATLELDRLMFQAMATLIGETKGTCERRNVGAVLVANGRLREIGWNGMERASDSPTCKGGACPRGKLTLEQQPPGSGYSNCIYLHAEFNVAENYRMFNGIRSREGWASQMAVTIYSSSVPCEDCTKYCAWAGITLMWKGKEEE